MRILSWLVVNALALAAAAWLLDGISLSGDNQLLSLVLVGAIFGLVTSFVRPVVQLLSLPLIIVTLGLMLIVINALMLMLTSSIANGLGLGFHVDGFWTAVWGSIVISICLMVLEAIFPGRRAR